MGDGVTVKTPGGIREFEIVNIFFKEQQ